MPPGLPEDSPEAAERNLIFYDNPHGIQPQPKVTGPVSVNQEPSAVPYAHGMLGQEYLKLRQIPATVAELKQAVALLPQNVATRSNLACALLLSGDLDSGEQEARQALGLDRDNPKTLGVLNQILSARRTQEASR